MVMGARPHVKCRKPGRETIFPFGVALWTKRTVWIDFAKNTQWRIQRGIQGCTGTPLWAAPSTKKYTDVRLNGTPPLATELRKLLLWLTLECFRRNSFENRSIGLVGLVVGLKNERIGRGLARKWAWLLKICARFARNSKSEPPL